MPGTGGGPRGALGVAVLASRGPAPLSRAKLQPTSCPGRTERPNRRSRYRPRTPLPSSITRSDPATRGAPSRTAGSAGPAPDHAGWSHEFGPEYPGAPRPGPRSPRELHLPLWQRSSKPRLDREFHPAVFRVRLAVLIDGNGCHMADFRNTMTAKRSRQIEESFRVLTFDGLSRPRSDHGG